MSPTHRRLTSNDPGSPSLNHEHDDLPHTLIPLTLAVGLIRHKGGYAERQVTEQGREGDFNMLAGFIAATVPLYEYSTDASTVPRALQAAELEGGMFRNGAKELRFLDGRATKRCLAVKATDVDCILALLRDPQTRRRSAAGSSVSARSR